jgi:DNA-directed RNA polymerase alpha subunit
MVSDKYKNIYFNKDVADLQLNESITNHLYNEDIKTIQMLRLMSRKDLKEKNFTDIEISNIQIKLQLLSLDLNGKVYNK